MAKPGDPMSKYFIIARVKDLPQDRLVEVLQKAYDEGASGSFETMAEPDDSTLIVFLRDEVDDCELVANRMSKMHDVIRAAIEQLVQELSDASSNYKLKNVSQQVRDTAWFPYPDGLTRAIRAVKAKKGEE